MNEVVRNGSEQTEAKRLDRERIQVIPIAKETTSRLPVSVSALNSCSAFSSASLKDFNL